MKKIAAALTLTVFAWLGVPSDAVGQPLTGVPVFLLPGPGINVFTEPTESPTIEVDAFAEFDLHFGARNWSVNRLDGPYYLQQVVRESAGFRIVLAAFESVPSGFMVPRYVAAVRMPGLPPGEYPLVVVNTVQRDASAIAVAPAARATLRVRGMAPDLTVAPLVLVRQDQQRHYLALGPTEAEMLLQIDPGPPRPAAWGRSEAPFKAWRGTSSAPAAAVPVCRFFHALHQTHFYSAKPEECAFLASRPDWANEGIAFRILLPKDGACPLGTQAVYRLFSAEFRNHRYTTSDVTYAALQLQGGTRGSGGGQPDVLNRPYAPEGIAFCAPL